jgi:hypothetical protein
MASLLLSCDQTISAESGFRFGDSATHTPTESNKVTTDTPPFRFGATDTTSTQDGFKFEGGNAHFFLFGTSSSNSTPHVSRCRKTRMMPIVWLSVHFSIVPTAWINVNTASPNAAECAFPPAPRQHSAEMDNNCFRGWELGHNLVDAADGGNIKKVQHLVEAGVDMNYARNDNVRNGLHLYNMYIKYAESVLPFNQLVMFNRSGQP